MKEPNPMMAPAAPCGAPSTRRLVRARPKHDAIRAALVQYARPDGISAKELAELAGQSQSYVCDVMRRLERAGEARIASYGVSPAGPTGQGGAACAFWVPVRPET